MHRFADLDERFYEIVKGYLVRDCSIRERPKKLCFKFDRFGFQLLRSFIVHDTPRPQNDGPVPVADLSEAGALP
ncbi:MAG TPA: hypothetical protein VGL08_16065, partial [Paraburkholderia sp.]